MTANSSWKNILKRAKSFSKFKANKAPKPNIQEPDHTTPTNSHPTISIPMKHAATNTKTRHSKYYVQENNAFNGIRSWRNNENLSEAETYMSNDENTTEQSFSAKSQHNQTQLPIKQLNYNQKLTSLRQVASKTTLPVNTANIQDEVISTEPLIKTIVNRPKLNLQNLESAGKLEGEAMLKPKTFAESDEFKLLKEYQDEDNKEKKVGFFGKINRAITAPFRGIYAIGLHIIQTVKYFINAINGIFTRFANQVRKVSISGKSMMSAITKFLVEFVSLLWAIIRMFGYIFTESGKSLLLLFGFRRNTLISKQDRKTS